MLQNLSGAGSLQLSAVLTEVRLTSVRKLYARAEALARAKIRRFSNFV